MAIYRYLHRRGVTSQWIDATETLLPGEIGIEYSEDQKYARLLIGNLDGTMDAMSFSPVSKIVTIFLSAANWEGENAPYVQTFELGTISGVTVNSKIDLQPTTSFLQYLQDEEITLTTENDAGIVRIYALGFKPQIDIQIQATISEVTT